MVSNSKEKYFYDDVWSHRLIVIQWASNTAHRLW